MRQNPAEDMDVCPFPFVVFCEVSGLCDDLITRSELSYHMCVCVSVYDLGTSTIRRPRPELDSGTAENKRLLRRNLNLQVALVLSLFFCMFFGSIT